MLGLIVVIGRARTGNGASVASRVPEAAEHPAAAHAADYVNTRLTRSVENGSGAAPPRMQAGLQVVMTLTATAPPFCSNLFGLLWNTDP
jgi:hypothetical protein